MLSDTVASRDGARPVAEHLANLRSSTLAEWQPPGGGAIGALNHAVVHGLDVTNALGLAATCESDAARAVLDGLTTGGMAARFDVDLTGLELQASDLDWSFGTGRRIVATYGELISLAAHRTLTDGRTLA